MPFYIFPLSPHCYLVTYIRGHVSLALFVDSIPSTRLSGGRTEPGFTSAINYVFVVYKWSYNTCAKKVVDIKEIV